MIHLLAPGALLGLLALAVPTVLHLRRPPPPTVWIGGLRHLDARPRRRPQWWRWRDRARLALRLALLAFLVAVLARPLWRRVDKPAPQRWSLVDPAGAPAGPSRERLDARRAAGDAVRLLTDGFPAFPQAGGTTLAPVNVWSLLRELDARLPAGSSLTVFSPARLDSLRGERPALGNVTVEWVETPLAETPDGVPTEPRTAPAPRVIILHTPDRASDARRLAAAIRMTTPPDATPPEVHVSIRPGPPPDPLPAAPADWVFCLGGSRPGSLAENAGVTGARNLLTDAGDAAPAEGGIGSGRLVAPELAGGPGVLVRRRVDLPPEPAVAVHWTDSAGRPVLTVGRGPEPGQRRWRFGSRFDPAWNDLPATTALAEVLRAWFSEPLNPAPDRRLAGTVQARPGQGGAAARPAGWPWTGDDDTVAGGPAVDLRAWALGLAAVGFLLERFWALRRNADRPPLRAPAR